jgi:hypothetical protein
VYTTIQTVMTGPCETEEGKRLLEEYDARHGVPNQQSAAATGSGRSYQWIQTGVLVAVAGVAAFYPFFATTH